MRRPLTTSIRPYDGDRILKSLMPQLKRLLNKAERLGFTMVDTAAAVSSYLMYSAYKAETRDLRSQTIAFDPRTPNDPIIITLDVYRQITQPQQHEEQGGDS